MKPAVLCAQRSKLSPHLQPNKSSIVEFHMDDIPYDAYNFINRGVADAKKEKNATLFSIAVMFPQLLPYIVIQCKDHVLMYERKGNEERLHGAYSIGVGGHIDNVDYAFAGYDEKAGVVYEPTFPDVIRYSAARELKEEIHLDVDPDSLFFNNAIIALDDEVSQVHIGLWTTIHIEEFADVRFSEEIINPKWIPISELSGYIDNAELWSKMIIESYTKDNLDV